MSEQQRQFLVATIMLGALAAGGALYYWFGFAKENIEELEKEWVKLDKERAELQRKLAEYEEFLKRKEEIEQAVEAIRLATERLPNERNQQLLVESIRDFIAKTGVDLTALEQAKQQGYTDWVEYPNTARGKTRYADYVQFLSLAEQNADFFMRVKSFLIQNEKDSPTTIHPFELTLSSFAFKE